MFSKGYCEKSTQTDVSKKKFHSELLVSHELKPCSKPSPATVKSQSSVILTVVHLPPQLHCPRIWSVTPATVGFGATDIFETFTYRCRSVFSDTDSGVVAHTI